MWMQRENVPEENRRFNLPEHCPDHCGGAFGDQSANGGSFAFKTPTARVGTSIHLVGQSKTRPSAAAIAKIAPDPDTFYVRFSSSLHDGR